MPCTSSVPRGYHQGALALQREHQSRDARAWSERHETFATRRPCRSRLLRHELGGIGALSALTSRDATVRAASMSTSRCRSHYGAVLLAFDRAADRLTSPNLLHWRLLPDVALGAQSATD